MRSHQRMAGAKLIAVAIVVAGLFVGPATSRTINDQRNPSRNGGAYTLSTTGVFEMKLNLRLGQRMTCETRNLGGRADPVLHILRGHNPDGPVSEVARDDDSAGNLNARVTVFAPTGGQYLLVVRAAATITPGTADLYCDGRLVWQRVGVGGAFQRVEGLRAGETLTTVTLPGGPRVHQLYALDQSGRMLRRHANGANESAFFTASAAPPMVIMVGSKWPDPEGDLRLVRNDARLPGHDPDGDGLGSELERAIGTCSSRSEVVGNWDCGRSADARDTDGDGLADGLELLGSVAAAPYQWLPRWGADPLHKDMFLEVDFALSTPGEAPKRMTPAHARELAIIYADQETSPVFRLRNAQSLNNPDGKPGISLHFDTGVSPPANATRMELALYGDWGGYDVSSPVKVDGNWQRADAANVWQSMMSPRRRGMFHYALGYPGSGGQAPVNTLALNLPLAFEGQSERDFRGSVDTSAHELGHTIGLDHSGPRDVGPGANCKPNYPSLMSYAFLGQDRANYVPTFSDGYGRSALSNVNLKEVGAIVSPTSIASARYLAHLEKVFGYSVDRSNGSVDWNRDGAYSATPIRAYANSNRAGCEFTRVNMIRSAGQTDGAIALTRLLGRTFLAYVDERDRRLHLSYTDSKLDCQIIGQGCGSLSDMVPAGNWNRDLRSVDMHPINVPEGPRLLLVYRSASGLFEGLVDRDGKVTNIRSLARGTPPDTELSLAGSGLQTWLALRNSQGAAVVRVRSPTGQWSNEQPMLDASGTALPAVVEGGTPGLLHARWASGDRKLLAAVPHVPDGSISLYEQDGVTGRWKLLPWGNPAEGTVGRPALAMEPVIAEAAIPGRLRVLYLRASPTGNRIVKMRTLDAKGIGSAARPEMVAEDHDNSWYYGNGVDLWFEPGTDSNLRAAVATAMLKEGVPQPRVIEFRPTADGIVNFIQRNWDDWAALGVGLCQIRRMGGAAVNCPPWPFGPPQQVTSPAAPQTQWPSGPNSPDQPQTAAQCRNSCISELQQCLQGGGSITVCRQVARRCQAECLGPQ